MKIIIATDDSPFSMNMINDFANRPLPADTKVKIISVYEKAPYMYRAPMGVLMEQYATADANSLKFAKNAIEKAAISIKNQNPELSIITAAIEGIPKKVIVDEAEAFDADLIILGSHGYGAIDRFLLGSVSQSVALHAKCSVEIVRKKIK
ncbi:universal stress protein [Flavobacterium frigidarium]|uniref:Universal stress protein n=1 Tax=Flavobacterium frigidarium TaxID=99286 RepID=A0ABV4KHJ2_9FLAO